MEPFDQWVASAAHPCIQKWSGQLLALGVSWDSFHSAANDVLQDLTSGDDGIPPVAARDIYRVASDELARSQAPMGIFWDLECTPIPSSMSGAHSCSRLKSALAPYGDLVQFRGYASIGLNLIPEKKRSELHLSGCHLVDCPHNGRKEVADKMIIVDAMKFAYDHPKGATLCFVTGDMDYAYLLAVLKQNPNWRTIVISRGSIDTTRMLHVNCDKRMCWETDVLETHYPPKQHLLPPPPGFEYHNDRLILKAHPLPSVENNVVQEEKKSNQEECTFGYSLSTNVQQLSVEEKQRGANEVIPKSSYVAVCQRVSDRSLTQSGNSQRKAETGDDSTFMALSRKCPIKEKDLTPKALEVVAERPFLLYVAWNPLLKGTSIVGHIRPYTVTTTKGIIYMFRSEKDAQKAIAQNEWLRHSGILFDWRERPESPKQLPCVSCKEIFFQSKMLESPNCLGQLFCESCFQESLFWDDTKRESAIESVVKVLETWERNDDTFVFVGILCKALCEGFSNDCKSKADAYFWINEAEAAGKVCQSVRSGSKSKIVFLPHVRDLVANSTSSNSIDTSQEEAFVIDLLRKNKGPLTRLQINTELKSHFVTTMNSSLNRKAVISNGTRNKSFTLVRSFDNQTVGLTYEDAQNLLTK